MRPVRCTTARSRRSIETSLGCRASTAPLFLTALREHFLPAIETGAFSGTTTWPKRLRIHRLTDSPIYSLTWNFASPDGRATFHLEQAAGGDQPVLVWRRTGSVTRS